MPQSAASRMIFDSKGKGRMKSGSALSASAGGENARETGVAVSEAAGGSVLA